MYSDFFDQIDAARNGRRGVSGIRGGAEASIVPETPPLVSFKAGKIKLVEQPVSSVPSPAYRCEADPARGEVRLVWSSSDRKVQWQWYDRRSKKVVDKYYITEAGSSTFERVDLSHSKKHKHDRVYVWTKKKASPSSNSGAEESKCDYDMYWMQDASDEKDDEIVAQVNQYLADPNSAAPEGTMAVDTATTTTAGAANASTSSATSRATGTGPRSSSQVDALSSILENLGMPQSAGDSGSSPAVASAMVPSGPDSTIPRSTGTKQLTLEDLQGAIAGIQAAQQQRETGAVIALNELVTPDAMTSILESDEAARQRLIALLPEGQQTADHLAENLRSPQVQATLRTLTQALLPDPDTGDLSGYASIIANFCLDPVDGQAALTSGNPVQAFLDCIIKSVEKEEEKGVDADAAMIVDTNAEEQMENDGNLPAEEQKDKKDANES